MGNPARALERLESLAGAGLDLVSLWRQAGPLFAEAVPHFESPCFFTVDPESMLTTSHFQEGLPEIPSEWLGREYAASDFNSMSEVLHSPTGVGTLHEATGGRPELSRKFHEEMQPFGCEQELLVALRTQGGESWGMVGLYRECGRPAFSALEIAGLRRVAPRLAAGVRHGLLVGQAEEPDLPHAPGLIIMDQDLGIDSATALASFWLDALGGTIDRLPESVMVVAGQALRHPRQEAESRVRSKGGGWLIVRGAALMRPDGRRYASVIMQAARPEHLAGLMMLAHGLTLREREIANLVLHGSSTEAIAGRLGVAGATVQQHLTNIFAKTGVRSRRELVASVFHRHYEPRVRDNERRTAAARPSRHGPVDR